MADSYGQATKDVRRHHNEGRKGPCYEVLRRKYNLGVDPGPIAKLNTLSGVDKFGFEIYAFSDPAKNANPFRGCI